MADTAEPPFQLWDLSKTPAKRVPIDDQDRPVNFVAFRPDSQQMALAHPDGFVRVHELPTGKLLKSLRVGQNLVGMAFHPNKPVLAVNCDATTQVLDVETEEALAKFLHPEPVNSVAWHPDGKKLATGCNDRRIYVWVWDVASPKPARVSPGPLRVLKGCKDVGISVHFNHAGDLLVSQEWGVTSRLWDWQMERELLSAPYLIGSRFSLDDRMVGTGINGRRVIISHLADRAFFRVLVRDPSLGEGYYSTCAVSPCGRILAAGMDDGVALWDLKLGTFLEFLRAEGSRAIVFDGAGGLLVNESRGVMRWPLRRDPASPMVLRLGPPQKLGEPSSEWDGELACSRDGGVIARAPRKNYAEVWHRDRPEVDGRLETPFGVRRIAVSPDGRWVAAGNHFGGSKVMVWDARSMKLEKELPEVDGRSILVFSPDGRWLGTNSGGIRLWEVNSWRAGPVLDPGDYNPFAFSPDSRMLAVETGGGAVRLINLTTRQELACLENPFQERMIDSICFSPDGTTLVGTVQTTSLHVWDLRAIRRELAELNLEGDWPTYPAEDGERPAAFQVKVEPIPEPQVTTQVGARN